jgi:hypothetical protein
MIYYSGASFFIDKNVNRKKVRLKENHEDAWLFTDKTNEYKTTL